jgi:hypothetical protein
MKCGLLQRVSQELLSHLDDIVLYTTVNRPTKLRANTVAYLVDALRYKPEGRGFDSR